MASKIIVTKNQEASTWAINSMIFAKHTCLDKYLYHFPSNEIIYLNLTVSLATELGTSVIILSIHFF